MWLSGHVHDIVKDYMLEETRAAVYVLVDDADVVKERVKEASAVSGEANREIVESVAKMGGG